MSYVGVPIISFADLWRADDLWVVALVDKLELKKLVRRSRSDSDRRAYVLALTAKGERVARDATKAVNAVEETFFTPLDAKERAELQSLSMRLLAEPGAIVNAHAAKRVR